LIFSTSRPGDQTAVNRRSQPPMSGGYRRLSAVNGGYRRLSAVRINFKFLTADRRLTRSTNGQLPPYQSATARLSLKKTALNCGEFHFQFSTKNYSSDSRETPARFRIIPRQSAAILNNPQESANKVPPPRPPTLDFFQLRIGSDYLGSFCRRTSDYFG